MAAIAYLKQAGVAASVDADVIKRFKDFAMPRFVSEINSIKVPRIDFDGGNIDNIGLSFAIKNTDSIDIRFSGADNGIVLRA